MAKANKQPYFRFFASDWLGGTRGMRAVETGVYITLIAMMYERCEPLPEDHKRLSRQCGCGQKAFAIILESLIEDDKIERSETGLWNDRVQKEFIFRENNSTLAKLAANKRWGKSNENNTDSVPTQCTGNADGMPTRSQKPETKKKERKSAPAKRGTRLPDDWTPTPDDIAFCMQEGLTEDDGTHIGERFKDYWIAQPGQKGLKLDWPATFRNWVRREIGYGTASGSNRVRGNGAAGGKRSSPPSAVEAAMRYIDRHSGDEPIQ